MPYSITVNGKKHTVDVEDDTPLLWVLRDTIGLVGPKFGCGGGFCGACTVHLDGTAVRSCQIQISKVGAKAVTTIEGVDASAIGRKVQKAWIDHDVIQCGYCQAGQIMSATALLTKTPQPSDKQIETAMNVNICRCATYTRIKSAIRQAAGLTPALAEAPAPRQVLAQASTDHKA